MGKERKGGGRGRKLTKICDYILKMMMTVMLEVMATSIDQLAAFFREEAKERERERMT